MIFDSHLQIQLSTFYTVFVSRFFPLTEIQYSRYLKVIFIHEHLHHLNTSLFQSMPHFPHSGHVFHYHCLLALRQNLRKDNPRLSLRLSSSCFSIPNAGFIGLGHHTQLLCSVLFLKHYKVSMLKGTGVNEKPQTLPPHSTDHVWLTAVPWPQHCYFSAVSIHGNCIWQTCSVTICTPPCWAWLVDQYLSCSNQVLWLLVSWVIILCPMTLLKSTERTGSFFLSSPPPSLHFIMFYLSCFF